jgi:hypothetical protein
MKQSAFLSILLIVIFVPVLGNTHAARQDAVDVRIISDNGSEYPKYRTYPRLCQAGAYFYMEAVKGERYSIEVANRSDRRIGVVIAVDGRNIISGQKSDLKNNERMYLIEPYATNTFEGWRTGMDRTNRFYFTEQSNSYAEKVFADASAMGTIAVAVYREKIREAAPITPNRDSLSRSRGASGKGCADRNEKESRSEQAGTGFGETTYSLAREVPFEPENAVAGTVVMKYEWRAELCRKGIISCGPRNRFWPDGVGFAPVPDDFRD